jgi:ABC-type Fe3+/spermidine/putrescine transport system ATPase subunit
MRVELRALQQRVGLTAIYVTHDQIEALAISDVVAVMSAGRLVEFGAPDKIYDWPKSRFAAEFIGAGNVVPVQEIQSVDGKTRGQVPWGKICFAHIGQAIPSALVIRPEDIQIVSHSAKDNVWPAKVEQVVFLGSIYDCRLALGEITLRAQFPRSTVVQVGQQVYIHVAERRCVPIQD